MGGRGEEREGREGEKKEKNAFSLLYGHFNSSLFTLVSFCALMRDKDVVLVMQIPACVRSGTYSDAGAASRGRFSLLAAAPALTLSPIKSMQMNIKVLEREHFLAFCFALCRVRKSHQLV